jgi:hypothetical protein
MMDIRMTLEVRRNTATTEILDLEPAGNFRIQLKATEVAGKVQYTARLQTSHDATDQLGVIALDDKVIATLVVGKCRRIAEHQIELLATFIQPGHDICSLQPMPRGGKAIQSKVFTSPLQVIV